MFIKCEEEKTTTKNEKTIRGMRVRDWGNVLEWNRTLKGAAILI